LSDGRDLERIHFRCNRGVGKTPDKFFHAALGSGKSPVRPFDRIGALCLLLNQILPSRARIRTMTSTKPSRANNPMMETPTITISVTNVQVELRCWPNHVSILFAMFEKLHTKKYLLVYSYWFIAVNLNLSVNIWYNQVQRTHHGNQVTNFLSTCHVIQCT